MSDVAAGALLSCTNGAIDAAQPPAPVSSAPPPSSSSVPAPPTVLRAPSAVSAAISQLFAPAPAAAAADVTLASPSPALPPLHGGPAVQTPSVETDAVARVAGIASGEGQQRRSRSGSLVGSLGSPAQLAGSAVFAGPSLVTDSPSNTPSPMPVMPVLNPPVPLAGGLAAAAAGGASAATPSPRLSGLVLGSGVGSSVGGVGVASGMAMGAGLGSIGLAQAVTSTTSRGSEGSAASTSAGSEGSAIFTPSPAARSLSSSRPASRSSSSGTPVSQGFAMALFDPSAINSAHQGGESGTGSAADTSNGSRNRVTTASPAHTKTGSGIFGSFSSASSSAASVAASSSSSPSASSSSSSSGFFPSLRKSSSLNTVGARSTGLGLRQRIQQQLSSMRLDKATRDKEEIAREWGACMSRWHAFQPGVCSSRGGSGGAGAGGTSASISASVLAANQRKLSSMLLATGIPSHLRASIWLLVIGNGLGLTPHLYQSLREQCAAKRMQYEQWRKRTNNMHLNAKHQQLADAAKAKAKQQQAEAEAERRAAELGQETNAQPMDDGVQPTQGMSAAPTPDVSPPPSGPLLSPSGSPGGADASLDPAMSMFSLIDQDLPRTFPELAFFHHGGPYEQSLRVVLECTAAYRAQKEQERAEAERMRIVSAEEEGAAPAPAPPSSTPSTGYVQGLSFLACILFLSLGAGDDGDAFLPFVALTNLLENPQEPLGALCSMDARVGEDWMARFEAQLAVSLPALHARWISGPDALGLRAGMFLYKWVLSVYAQSLPLDAVFRVWDCFLWEAFKNRAATNVGGTPIVPPAPASTSSPRSAVGRAISPAAGTAAAGGAGGSSGGSSPSFGSVNGVGGGGSVSGGGGGGGGFPFLFRVALGILSMYADALCQVGFEEALHFLHHLPGKRPAPSGGGSGQGGDAAAAAGEAGSAAAAAATEEPDEFDIDLLFQHIKTIHMLPAIWNPTGTK